MTLKRLREHYVKLSGFMVTVAGFLYLVAASMAVYIIDAATLAGEDSGTAFNILNLTFITGIFLVILSIIVGFYAFAKKSEGSILFTKVIAVVDGIIGLLFSGAIIYSLATEKKIWADTYTRNIYIIAVISGILLLVYAMSSFIFSKNAAKYFDGKKSASELPDIAEEHIHRQYYGIMALTNSIISAAVMFVALFNKDQIEKFYKNLGEKAHWHKDFFGVIFVIGMVVTAIVLVLAILYMAEAKLKNTGLLLKIAQGISGLTMVVYQLVALTMNGSKHMNAGAPDISYIIFSLILIILAIPTISGVIRNANRHS